MEDRFKFRIIVNTDVKTINGTFEGQNIYYCNGFIQTKFKTYFFGNNKRYVFLNSQIKTINQCTGLKDKNGKLIYEGDIVKDDYNELARVEYSTHFQRLHLFFNPGCRKHLKYYSKLGVHIFNWIYPVNTLEVIGNIYENPELLKGEK